MSELVVTSSGTVDADAVAPDAPAPTAATAVAADASTERAWWRSAVIYEVYPRSFADGERRRDRRPRRRPLPPALPRDLGVDAIWFTPWYVSPLADGGYDVADYRAIDPAFGTLEEAEQLIAEAARGRDPDDRRHRPQPRLRPSTRGSRRRSPSAPARRSAPGSGSARAAGPNGDEMPTAWPSQLLRARPGPGRPTPTARPASGTSTCSRRSSRTSTGTTRTSAASTRTILRVLVRPRRRRHPDRLGGPAGQGPGAARDPGRPRPGRAPATPTATSSTTIYRSWRAIADALPGHARARRRGLAARRRAVRAVPPARTSSTPRSTSTSWPGRGTPRSLRESIDVTLAAHAPGRRAGDLAALQPRRHPARDPLRARGHRRSRSPPSATAPRPTSTSGGAGHARRPSSCAALPGSLYIYQGEELGLDEVAGPAGRPAPGPDALPLGRRRSRPRRLPRAAAVVGRPSRRSASAPAAPTRRAVAAPAGRLGRPDGRGPAARPGLDAQPVSRRARASAASSPTSATDRCAWLPSPDGVLAFARGDRFVVVTNLSAGAVDAAGRRRASCSPARASSTAGCRPMRRPGSGSTPTPRPEAGPRQGKRHEEELMTDRHRAGDDPQSTSDLRWSRPGKRVTRHDNRTSAPIRGARDRRPDRRRSSPRAARRARRRRRPPPPPAAPATPRQHAPAPPAARARHDHRRRAPARAPPRRPSTR